MSKIMRQLEQEARAARDKKKQEQQEDGITYEEVNFHDAGFPWPFPSQPLEIDILIDSD